jgi:hypothetical protein
LVKAFIIASSGNVGSRLHAQAIAGSRIVLP